MMKFLRASKIEPQPWLITSALNHSSTCLWTGRVPSRVARQEPPLKPTGRRHGGLVSGISILARESSTSSTFKTDTTWVSWT